MVLNKKETALVEGAALGLVGAIGNMCAVDPRCNLHHQFQTASGIFNDICMLAIRDIMNDANKRNNLL